MGIKSGCCFLPHLVENDPILSCKGTDQLWTLSINLWTMVYNRVYIRSEI
jgi:hypothetical protein